MGFRDAVRTCLAKYATFSGRASRPEYWWFVLFAFLGQVALGIVDNVLFGAQAALLAPLFSLFTLLPGLAAGWRRMHDTGRSGLYVLYPLIVLVGIFSFAGISDGAPPGALQGLSATVLVIAGLVFLISPLLVLWWLTRPTQPGVNRYGPPPPDRVPPSR